MDPVFKNILYFILFILWIFIYLLKIRSVKAFREFLKSFSGSAKAEAFQQYLRVLSAHSSFFTQLSEEGKQVFIKKCTRFVTTKRYIGMEGLMVTDEMKIRIAATAVQVSYGMSNSVFSHYHTVKIFPETFYSRMHDRFLKGGTSTSGYLYFSWKDFEQGFADPSDRYNLGLHEMAHALRLQLKHGGDFDFRFANYVDHWVELALPEFERMNEGKTSFLREYGGTNIEEFFAVCMEHFFEVPFEFKKQLPDIYNHLAFLLNLDPTNTKNDFRLEQGFIASVNSDSSLAPIPLKVQKSYKYDSWHWSFYFIISGLFIALPIILIMHGKVLFEPYHIVLIFSVITAIVTTFRKFFHSKGIEFFRHLMFFCITGAAPIGCAIILVTNYYVKWGYESITYPVISQQFVVRNIDGARMGFYYLQLKDGAYNKFTEIRMIPSDEIKGFVHNKSLYLVITTSKGLWGLQNLENREVLVYDRPEVPEDTE